jgi:hypothetical protein
MEMKRINLVVKEGIVVSITFRVYGDGASYWEKGKVYRKGESVEWR